MLIKVCGMREPDNIRAVSALGVDMIGFVFCKNSSRCVPLVPSCAGTVPDRADAAVDNDGADGNRNTARAGVFNNDMPQNIITMVHSYKLDYVQLNGSESSVMIDNLRRTVDPDIRPGVKFIKRLNVSSPDDMKRWREYEDSADILLFHVEDCADSRCGECRGWSVVDSYDGSLPFILGGDIRPDDAGRILAVSHPRLAGVDLDRHFELSPAVKDTELLKKFITEIRSSGF